MQLVWYDVVILMVVALVSGIAAAFFKLNEEAEVRNRGGDFQALVVLRTITKLFMSSVPSGFNYASANITKAHTRSLVHEIHERIDALVSIVCKAAAESNPKYRKDLYAIGVKLGFIDSIHIVQLMIANANKESELPAGGLREYLTGVIRDRESEAHLEVSRFLGFMNKIREIMETDHFGNRNMDIYLLKRMEELENTETRKLSRAMAKKSMKVVREQQEKAKG